MAIKSHKINSIKARQIQANAHNNYFYFAVILHGFALIVWLVICVKLKKVKYYFLSNDNTREVIAFATIKPFYSYRMRVFLRAFKLWLDIELIILQKKINCMEWNAIQMRLRPYNSFDRNNIWIQAKWRQVNEWKLLYLTNAAIFVHFLWLISYLFSSYNVDVISFGVL